MRKTDNGATTLATHVLARMEPSDRTLMVGPVVWRLNEGHDVREWYFTVAMYDGRRNRCAWDLIVGAPGLDLYQERSNLIFALLQHRPIVVHDCVDELDMAKWCEATWPGAHITAIRQAIERERAA